MTADDSQLEGEISSEIRDTSSEHERYADSARDLAASSADALFVASMGLLLSIFATKSLDFRQLLQQLSGVRAAISYLAESIASRLGG